MKGIFQELDKQHQTLGTTVDTLRRTQESLSKVEGNKDIIDKIEKDIRLLQGYLTRSGQV